MTSPKGLPVALISCPVLQDMFERLLPEGLAGKITYTDYGVHRMPKTMNSTVQEVLNTIQTPSLVILGFGLCGNGLNNLRAGRHTLLVPRTDDCIAILLGSHSMYIREFQTVPGTYYLTKGWLESGSNPFSEYKELVPIYGAEEAMWIMDQQYQHYKRLVLVAQSREDMDKYRPQALEVARFCERWSMRYEELLGSEEYVRCLVEAAIALSGGKGLPARFRDELLVIPPGAQIEQEMFIRLD